MRKPDEIALAREMLKYGAYGNANVDGVVFTRLGIPERRACYIFRKWANRGWAESGVSARFSWLTPKGVQELPRICVPPCDDCNDGKCETRCTAHVVVTFTGGYYDISLGHSYCPKVENRYLGPAVFHFEEKVFITTCTIPLLE